MFELFVSPLLRGIKPATPPEVQAQGTNTQSGVLLAAEEPPAIQFTQAVTGTLQSGERLEFALRAELGAPLTFNIIGLPSQLRVSLREPNGTISTPDAVATGVSYGSFADNFYPLTQYTVASPSAGSYTVIVEATTATPASGVSVPVTMSLQSTTQLELLEQASPPVVNQPSAIAVRLHQNGIPLSNANVVTTLIGPDGVQQRLPMRDDGRSGDLASGDGVYGVLFTPTSPSVYHAIISAEAVVDGAPISRSRVWVAQIAGERLLLPLIWR